MSEPRETINYEELYQRVKALIARVETAATKTTLVLMLATRTVNDAWWFTGTRVGIDQAEAELLEQIKKWSKDGRAHNLGRRSDRLLQQLRENDEARAAGRRAPHTFAAPKKRRKRRAVK
jgi:hypothetical protein